MNWVLDDLVERVDGITQAVVLSRDGLALASSNGLSQPDAEHMAAIAAGLQSLARGAGQQFGGGAVRQTIIEMESALLLIASSGQGTCLAVLCSADANPGLIAYEMALLAKRIGQHLVAIPRLSAGPAPESNGAAPDPAAADGTS
jgi:predicted regulator of Ras-like GTPase activity (Roadblock/LC7/MglB family)